LVTEPSTAPLDLSEVVSATGSPWGADGRWVLTNGPDVTPLKTKLYSRFPLEDKPPPAIAEDGDTWRRVHTASDGLVDWSEFCFTPQQRVAMAGTGFELDQAEWRTLKLASTGPVRLYVNGKCVLHAEDFSYMEPVEHEVRVWLPYRDFAVVVPPQNRTEPVGTPSQWRREVLEHSARANGCAAELAATGLDPDHVPRRAAAGGMAGQGSSTPANTGSTTTC
jgi:hypothetical protein